MRHRFLDIHIFFQDNTDVMHILFYVYANCQGQLTGTLHGRISFLLHDLKVRKL